MLMTGVARAGIVLRPCSSGAVSLGSCGNWLGHRPLATEDGQGEDDKADAGEKERDPDDDPEERDLLRHVGDVEGRRERRLVDPDAITPPALDDQRGGCASVVGVAA
jgi:hypothetical protein